MLVPYGYIELEKSLLQRFYDALVASQCMYTGSDLMNALTYKNYKEFVDVIAKAQNACISLRIPLRLHFKSIYISRPDGLYHDYRLSRFACYLITVNADSRYPAVAKAQVLLAMRKQ